MFADLRALGAQTIAELLKSDPASFGLARGFATRPGVVPDSFAMLDANHDGLVTLAEIQSFSIGDPVPEGQPDPLRKFLNGVTDIMALGTGGEDLQGIGVTLPAVQKDVDRLVFSYDGLQRLTRQFADKHGVARSLIAKLVAAEDAEKRGKLRAKRAALEAYLHEVDAQEGKALSEQEADSLRCLAMTF